MRFAIVGGGASGMFAAANAARMHPGCEVVIFEKKPAVLAKVAVSGGGRCNLTHQCESIADLLENYPQGKNFLKKAFYRFSNADTRQWFEQRNVPLYADAEGCVFPKSNDSQSIIRCLLDECEHYGVTIKTGHELGKLEKTTSGWKLTFTNGELFECDAVMLAVGGLKHSPQFDFIRALQHSVQEPVPSLFSFEVDDPEMQQLMGLTVDPVQVKLAGTKISAQGVLLFTHWGLSGPAILRLSAWAARKLHEADYRFQIAVNWLPQLPLPEVAEILLHMPHQKNVAFLWEHNPFDLPKRLWHFLLEKSQIPENRRWAELTVKERNALQNNLTAQLISVTGRSKVAGEFVTSGGIALSEVDPVTMQSRLHRGLFFGGEFLDVDGLTGGFNLQHAWTSGWIVANSVAVAVATVSKKTKPPTEIKFGRMPDFSKQ